MSARIQLLRVPLNNVTMQQALTLLDERLDAPGPTQVSFVNADCVNITRRDPEYLNTLRQSDLNFIDGFGMNLAGRWYGKRVVDNVNGTDMLPLLCSRLAARGKSLFLFGAQPGVANKAAEWIERNFPGLKIAGVEHGYVSPSDEPAMIQRIAAASPDVLLVALGAPRQEKWIRRHLPTLNAKVVIGVGGLFDYYSGRIPRAPRWIRKIGFEWVWRVYQEPRRLFWRYFLGNPLFLARMIFERGAGDEPVRPVASTEVKQ